MPGIRGSTPPGESHHQLEVKLSDLLPKFISGFLRQNGQSENRSEDRVECISCSAKLRESVSVKSSGWKAHLKSAKHLRNQIPAEIQGTRHTSDSTLISASSSHPALLSLAEQLCASSDSEEDEGVMMDIQDGDQDVFVENRDIHSMYLDRDGNSIEFSAGEISDRNQPKFREQMEVELEELEYQDHTIFAEEDFGLDSTLSNVAAMFGALGAPKFCQQDLRAD